MYDSEVSEFKEDFADLLNENMDRWELGVVMQFFSVFIQSFNNLEPVPVIEVNEEDMVQHQIAQPYLQMAWSIACNLFFGAEIPMVYTN